MPVYECSGGPGVGRRSSDMYVGAMKSCATVVGGGIGELVWAAAPFISKLLDQLYIFGFA